MSSRPIWYPGWAILAPQKRWKITMSTSFPHDTLFGESKSFDAWKLLMRPLSYTRQHLVTSPWNSTRSDTQSTLAYSKLDTFPLEMLSQTILNMEKVDVISLGLTNHNMWQSVLYHVQHSVATYEVPLAGVRLACCSTNAPDLPAGFLENNLLEDAIIDNLTGKKGDLSANALIRSCMENFDELEHTDLEQEWSGAFSKAVEKCNRETTLDGEIVKILQQELAQCFSSTPSPQSDSKYALRNLTLKEYVRIGHPVQKSGTPSRTILDQRFTSTQCTLEDIILLRACWNKEYEYDWTTMSDTNKYLRGPWAGHALDVVPMKDFEDSVKSQTEAWKDVTKEIADLVTEANARIMSIRYHPLF